MVVDNESDGDRPATKEDLRLMVENLRRQMITATVWFVVCTTLSTVVTMLLIAYLT